MLAYQQTRAICGSILTERRPQSASVVQMFLDQQRANLASIPTGLTLKSNDQLIGNCGIRLESVDTMKGHRYELSPEHWGWLCD